jgi:predicted ATPase
MTSAPTPIPVRPGQRRSAFENDNHACDVSANWENFHQDFPVLSHASEACASPPPAPPVHRVVVSGGPCGGKTTAMADVGERLRARGFGVFVVPEAASLLFTGGATFADATSAQISVFQEALLRTQMALEDNFFRIASASARPSVLLCDRGAMDGKAYMTSAEWAAMLRANKWDPVCLRDERYDLVIHMVTAADGAVPFYQLENNAARTESVDEARVVDKRTQNAWVGHPHLRIIDNRTGFREKIDRVFSNIGKLVGVHDISKSREIRKYVVLPLVSIHAQVAASV